MVYCEAVAGSGGAALIKVFSSPNDPRIEIISVIHFLGKKKCKTAFERSYKQEVMERFGKYKGHTAVLYWRAIEEKYHLYPNEVSVNLVMEKGRFYIQKQDNNGFFTKLSERERVEFVRLLNDFNYRSSFIAYYNELVLHSNI